MLKWINQVGKLRPATLSTLQAREEVLAKARGVHMTAALVVDVLKLRRVVKCHEALAVSDVFENHR